MQDNLNKYLTEIEILHQQQLYRKPITYIPISATKVLKDNEEFLMMASNNYLGLTHHPQVKKAAIKAIEKYGTGSGGSRLISGSHILFAKLEQALAEFKSTEKALVFNTGYMANVGTISALTNNNDYIINDELNHASIIDGCRLSKAKTLIYCHKNMADLENILKNLPYSHTKLIVTDSVFSMDGDIAPLDEIAYLAHKYNALTMVDDAHATGVLGKGHGSVEHFHLQGKIDIQLGTLSKALASEGGFVAGKKILIEYLINKARSYIFSTALTPADIASSLEALSLIANDNSLVDKLYDNISYVQNLLRQNNIDINLTTPIVPIIVHSNEKALQIAQKLYEKHIILSAIRPPTVPQNQSRLRLTISASHTQEDLNFVITELIKLL